MTMEYPRHEISNTRFYVGMAALVGIVSTAGVSITQLPIGPEVEANLKYIVSAVVIVAIAGTLAMITLLWMNGPHRMK